MADMHVVTGNENGEWDIIMHFAVPDINNDVGVNYRTALINSGSGVTTSLPDGDGTEGTIDATEKASIESGALHEHRARFLVESGGSSNAELQTTLRAFYTQEKTRILDKLQMQLRYFGHTESEL